MNASAVLSAFIATFGTPLVPTAVALARAVVSFFARLAQALTSPLRDLNSGDAQDYLLFLVGLSVLVLVLPLLR